MSFIIIFFAVVIILILASAITVIFWFFNKVKNKGKITRAMNLELFLVTLPKFEQVAGEEKKTFKEQGAIMEQFFAILSSIKEKKFKKFLYGPPDFCLEIALPSVGEEISFYYACPKKYVGLLEKQIHGLFSEANIEQARDYNIFNSSGVVAGATVSLEKSYILPLKTYQQIETDPLSEITTALSKLEAQGEGAAVQIILRSAHSDWSKPAIKVVQLMQEGKTLAQAQAQAFQGKASKGLDRAVGLAGEVWGKNREQSQDQKSLDEQNKPKAFQQQTIDLIEGKAAKYGFEVNLRLLASAETQARAEQILSHLEKSFVQFRSPVLNGLKIQTIKKRALKKLIYNFSFRIFSKQNKIILNTEELSSIYHFPVTGLATPKVAFVKAKSAPAPANMPQGGVILGRNIFRGVETQARSGTNDRCRHLYVVGQTGVGKSALLREMIRQDIEAGHGVGVVDPHGDLVESILGIVPSTRAKDVIYFDPGDVERPMGLNMLEYKTEEQKDFAVQEMVRIWEKLFPPEMIGPMFEHNMRNAMLTLMADKDDPGTIVEIPRIFTDDAFAKYRLQKVTDPLVRDFWEKEMAKTTAQTRSEMLGYLISKVGRFVENAMMRNIIGQPHSAFDFRDVMDNQKILLLNLSKGRVGEVNSSLLGLVAVSKLQMAAMSRGDLPEDQRKDFYLYLDEFQNFTTESIATILSEARKYRLGMIIAHQFIGQLSEQIRDAVFGNVGSLVSFRVGANDAEFLVKQFEPVFNQQDLINLDNFNCCVKLIINNQTALPFSMGTYPPVKSNLESAGMVKQLSRARFGRDRAEVEQEIIKRANFGAGVASEQVMTPGERNL